MRTRLALACLATIGVADYVILRRPPRWHAIALFDHPAHIATAALLMPRDRSRYWKASFLAGALLPDVDHLPLAVQDPEPGDPRPETHTVFAVAPVALRSRATAAGMLTHLMRDLALDPGVPLFWPLSKRERRIPYGAYVAVMTVRALVADRRN